jgi:hypothetical protein
MMSKELTILDKATTTEKIIAILQSNEDVEDIKCPKLREQFQRVMHIDELTRKYKLPSKVIPMHMHRFSVSHSTAKRDYYHMTKIMNQISNIDKEYERAMMMAWIKEVANKADIEGRYKEFSALMREYRAFGQFDIPDIEVPQQNLEPHTLELTYDVSILGLDPVENLEAKRKALMSKRRIAKLEVEDIEPVNT